MGGCRAPARGCGRLGRLPQVVNEIGRGEKVITPYIALPRAMAMGGVHRFWPNLEADCRLALARLGNRCRSIQPACPVGWHSWPERWFPAGVCCREAYPETKPLRC